VASGNKLPRRLLLDAVNSRCIVCLLLVAACGSSSGSVSGSGAADGGSDTQTALTPAAAVVFVGERTRLTPVFDGDSAVIDGIGPVQSGVAVDTAALARTTTFTLRVIRGGARIEASTTVQAKYRNRIRTLAAAPIAQTNHVAAALPDGRAIVMGGNTSASLDVPDSTLTQIFDPATERFTPGPELLFSGLAQTFTSASPLGGGSFLLVGTGINTGGRLQSVITQVFDSAASGFTRVGDAATPFDSFRVATPLADGGVLLTGGFGRGDIPIVNAVDRFDPVSSQWRALRAMGEVRVSHTATLLNDGRVLVTGGLSCCHDPPDPTFDFFALSAEIYDPSTDSFSPTGTMKVARGLHAAALLSDGRVLISGGNGNDPDGSPLNTEIYDPVTGQFSPGGDLRTARDSHAAVALTDGRVLVIGGELPPALSGFVGAGVPTTEIFDPATGQWSEGPALEPAFFAATVTMLANGKVLVFGGQDVSGFPQAAAALFE
jgi:Galactose oxidase, central domain